MAGIGGVLSALGGWGPGWVQGRELGIEKTWSDLKNFNEVGKGQRENMWTDATWLPALTNVYNNTANNELNLKSNLYKSLLEDITFSGKAQQGYDFNEAVAAGAFLPQGVTLPKGAAGQRRTQNTPQLLAALLGLTPEELASIGLGGQQAAGQQAAGQQPAGQQPAGQQPGTTPAAASQPSTPGTPAGDNAAAPTNAGTPASAAGQQPQTPNGQQLTPRAALIYALMHGGGGYGLGGMYSFYPFGLNMGLPQPYMSAYR